MNIYNITVVFAPNFFRPKIPTIDDFKIHAKTMCDVL
jgi:hypothetical protein